MKNWKRWAVIPAALIALVATSASSCDTDTLPQNNPVAADNFKKQEANKPVPPLTNSLERANVAEHLKRNNQPDRVRYIYLLADTGGIYAYFVIKGKVTSAGAQLTPTDSIVDPCASSYCPTVVQGPTDDGSFGGDEGGIYFFTDTGAEIQWNGRWLLTDQPMKIQSPTLTLTTK